MSRLSRWLRSKRVGLEAAHVRVRVHSFWMNLDLGDAIQKQVHLGGYEPAQTAWISNSLKPGHRFVDIGANCGYYTALASKLVGPNGQVFSFEPSPIVSTIIADMIADNRISNIELVKSAVGADNGEVEIYMPDGAPVHSPSAFFSDPTFKTIRVPMLALDSYALLNDGRPLDFVKIDVEGFEPNVIDGMKNLIKDGYVKNLLCEFNSGWLRRNANYTSKRLLESVLDLGMSIHNKTESSIGMEPDGITPFEVQDIWFKRSR